MHQPYSRGLTSANCLQTVLLQETPNTETYCARTGFGFLSKMVLAQSIFSNFYSLLWLCLLLLDRKDGIVWKCHETKHSVQHTFMVQPWQQREPLSYSDKCSIQVLLVKLFPISDRKNDINLHLQKTFRSLWKLFSKVHNIKHEIVLCYKGQCNGCAQDLHLPASGAMHSHLYIVT